MNDDPIDLSIFAELRDSTGDEFVTELVAAFIEETPAMLATLRETGKGTDATKICRAAHSIKSTSMTLGAMALADLARAIERGERIADDSTCDALDKAYAHAVTLLKDLCDG